MPVEETSVHAVVYKEPLPIELPIEHALIERGGSRGEVVLGGFERREA